MEKKSISSNNPTLNEIKGAVTGQKLMGACWHMLEHLGIEKIKFYFFNRLATCYFSHLTNELHVSSPYLLICYFMVCN